MPSPVADRAELLEMLTVQARKGHVGAMRLLLQELRADGAKEPAEPRSTIDELARRREAAP